jgi:MarR family transcriptional regulator for hemolysin
MTTSREELVDEIEDRFRQLNWQGRLRLRRRLEAFDLTVPQFVVLSTVRRLGYGATMSAVSDAIQLPRSSMTSIADRLCELDLLRRGPIEGDRRAVAVTITEAGTKLVETVESAGHADLLRIADELPTADLAAFVRTLTWLLDGLNALPSSTVPTPTNDAPVHG